MAPNKMPEERKNVLNELARKRPKAAKAISNASTSEEKNAELRKWDKERRRTLKKMP